MYDNEFNRDMWIKYAIISAIVTAILFFIMTRFEDGSTEVKIFAIPALCGIGFTIFSVIKANIYNAKSKNMSADEYVVDRFENAIPEAKSLWGIKDDTLPKTVKCPNCGASSTNIKRITTLNRAISVNLVGIASDKIGKQFECNQCHYKW